MDISQSHVKLDGVCADYIISPLGKVATQACWGSSTLPDGAIPHSPEYALFGLMQGSSKEVPRACVTQSSMESAWTLLEHSAVG